VEWLSENADALGAVLAILSIIGILGGCAWKIVSGISRIMDAVEDLQAEMKPNSGSSLRDAINRMEVQQTYLAKTLADHAHRDEQVLEEINRRFGEITRS
jgi:hypothetical protein